ncbi:hypothetical protein [Aliiroseovarius sp. S253]|uniref:hypothetical protein n=1 Tax=Aliiroseovarius sp. S253 TaxID=3415133 RepID=UPI003C7A7B25
MQEKQGIAPVIFTIEEEGETYAYDGLIDEVYGQPIVAKVAVNNDKRITYSWKVQGDFGTNADRGNSINMNISYRLTRQKANGAATIRAMIVGYDNTFRSKGTCEVAK